MSVTRERGITTPLVRTQSANIGGGSFESQLSEFALQTADFLAEKADRKFEMDFRNDAQEGINNAFERNQSDPAQLQKELRSLRNGLIKNAPRNLRDSFDASFTQASRPLLNKSTNNYERVLTDQLKASSLQNLQHGRVAMTRISSDLLSSDPLVVTDATSAGQAKILEMINTVSQTDKAGIPVFSANDRFSLIKNFVDETAFSAARDAYDDSEDKEDFLARFESGEMKASIFIDEEGNFIEGSLKEQMDRTVFERTRNYMEADIKSIKLGSERQIQRRLKLIVDDPALLAIEDGVRADDFEGLIEKQRQQGVKEGNISILPKQQAALITNQLNGIISADDMIVELARLETQVFGSARMFDRALKDLKRAGLSELVETAVMMNPETDRNVMVAAFGMALEPKNITADSKARGVKQRDIIETVEGKISDVRDMLLAEGGETAGLGRQFEAITTFFTAQGKSVEEAATLATDWFIKQTPIININGKNTRVTGKEDSDSMENGLEIALNNLSLDNVSINVGTGKFTLSNIKRNSQFVLAPGEEHYYLLHSTGGTVTDREGKALEFPISKVLELDRAEKERRKREAFERALKGFEEE